MGRIIPLLLISVVCYGDVWAGPNKWRTDYDQYFNKYSKRFFGPGLRWQWFKAQAVAESGLNDKAKSWLNAKGVMQLMPSTFEDVKQKLPKDVVIGLPNCADSCIHDPRWNIAAGIFYDHWLMSNYWKNVEPDTNRLTFTFASYNAGQGTLLKAQAIAKQRGLLETLWDSIVEIAPEVPRWRHKETLSYVEKIKVLVEEVDR